MIGLVVPVAGGCASFKSPTQWFAKDPQASMGGAPATSGFASKLSKTGQGISNQFKSMGTAVSSAYAKTKSAVSSTFIVDKTNDDPTSLSSIPKNLGPEIWVTNGQVYESRGDFSKALDNYTKALELEPNNIAALESTARLYSRQNQHAQAAEFLNKILAVQPAAATYNELALAYQNQGKTAEAQGSVQQAISLDPSNVRYRNNLAGILVAEGRSDEAVKELEQVFPPAIANYNVAFLHFKKQNMAAAQQHLQLALQLDPNLAPQARDLMDKIGQSAAGRTAMATYKTADSIYRTAEALASPTVPANPAIYQPASAGTPAAR